MNRAEKSAVIDEIAASITDANAIFAVDYRGITVVQAAELRARLRENDATLRVVKNSLTERAADKAGVEQLKALLAGPTALTFVRGDGAAAAKSLADFARTTQLLAFKGGLMDGAALSPAEITTISRLPSRDVLYGQLVSLVATPISGLARTLNALVSGLAVALAGVLEQKEAAAPPVAPAHAAAATPASAPDGEPGASGEPAGVEEDPTGEMDAGEATEPPAEQPAAEEPAADESAAEATDATAETTEQASPEEPAAAGEPEEESPQASSDDASTTDSE